MKKKKSSIIHTLRRSCDELDELTTLFVGHVHDSNPEPLDDLMGLIAAKVSDIARSLPIGEIDLVDAAEQQLELLVVKDGEVVNDLLAQDVLEALVKGRELLGHAGVEAVRGDRLQILHLGLLGDHDILAVRLEVDDPDPTRRVLLRDREAQVPVLGEVLGDGGVQNQLDLGPEEAGVVDLKVLPVERQPQQLFVKGSGEVHRDGGLESEHLGVKERLGTYLAGQHIILHGKAGVDDWEKVCRVIN